MYTFYTELSNNPEKLVTCADFNNRSVYCRYLPGLIQRIKITKTYSLFTFGDGLNIVDSEGNQPE